MTAGDYTIDMTVGAWTATIAKGDLTDPAADIITVDPMHAEWSMTGPYPSQPTPTTVSFGLFVPDGAAGPTPLQGDRVEIVIATPGAGAGYDPVFDFVGQITSTNAIPTRVRRGPLGAYVKGLRFPIVATDYRNAFGEERIGDEPWPAESRYARLNRIIGLTEFDLTVLATDDTRMIVSGLGPDVAARDVDSQPTFQLVTEVLGAAALWLGMSPAFYVYGYIDQSWRTPGLNTWARPIVRQAVDGLGNVSFPIAFVTGGGVDTDAALPYHVDMIGGSLGLVRKAITPSDSLVSWLPAAAVEAESVSWRQDKAGNTNRVRLTAPSLYVQGIVKTGSFTAEFADLVAANGPNEVVIQLDADQTDFTQITELMHSQLGTQYDGTPRWAMDTFTIRAEEIADGDQWPRLFDPREHADGIADSALGRFVLITDPDPAWNLHDGPDYWGRLAAATLDLEGGKIRWSATLAHRLPIGIGKPIDYLGAVSSHHGITYAELGAAENPTYAQAGTLTYADMELVED